MSDHRLTSPDEARYLSREISALVDRLERAGFDRGQIGAVISGIGLALVQVHSSPALVLQIVDGLRDVLMADQAVKS